MSDPRTDARAARAALDRLLETDASALSAELPPGFGDAVEHYVTLLLETNARLNLTRVVQPEAVARLHLLDALAALPLLRDLSADSHGLDLGSGGGVPGIVLALARPDLRWTLVDSVRKKADALAGFVGALQLPNVEVLPERAEVLGHGPLRERVDVVTARACAALPVLAEYALPLLRRGGRLVAWKGLIGDAELAAGSGASATLGGSPPDVRSTGLEVLGDHRFVRVDKVQRSPARYPRRPGEPARRPLG